MLNHRMITTTMPIHNRSLSQCCFALLLILTLAACGDVAPPPSDNSAPPTRIVSLVPAVTEMLFALGAGELVVGVSSFDSYPTEVLELPQVGALVDANLEAVFALEPDLVVTYGTQATLDERLGGAGIETFPFVSGSIADMLVSLETLSVVIGREEAGRELVADLVATFDAVRDRAPPERPTVLLVHSRDPGTMGSFYTEGELSYFNELIEMGGGRNLFADVSMKVFQPSLEEVLARGPEIIIELLPSSGGGSEKIQQRLADWNQLATVPAVRNGRVYVLADDYLLIIGPRLGRVATQLAEVIHPPAPSDQ